MNMRAPTNLEIELMNGMMYLFRDEKGYMYVSSHGASNSPADKMIETRYFSPKERTLIQDFEIPPAPIDRENTDLFPETLPPLEEYMRFYVSRMLEILQTQGTYSAEFLTIQKQIPSVQIVQTESIGWDPEK